MHAKIYVVFADPLHLCSSNYNPLFRFQYNINGTPCDMVFTSVAGHLLELDFEPQYKKWRGCSPVELFTAPVHKVVPKVTERSYVPLSAQDGVVLI